MSAQSCVQQFYPSSPNSNDNPSLRHLAKPVENSGKDCWSSWKKKHGKTLRFEELLHLLGLSVEFVVNMDELQRVRRFMETIMSCASLLCRLWAKNPKWFPAAKPRDLEVATHLHFSGNLQKWRKSPNHQKSRDHVSRTVFRKPKGNLFYIIQQFMLWVHLFRVSCSPWQPSPHLSNSTSRSSGVATCNKPSAVASVWICLSDLHIL